MEVNLALSNSSNLIFPEVPAVAGTDNRSFPKKISGVKVRSGRGGDENIFSLEFGAHRPVGSFLGRRNEVRFVSSRVFGENSADGG
jgi:hypothetical protein